MTKKPKRPKRATKSSKRTKVAAQPVEKTKAATKSAPADAPLVTPAITRSKAARAHIAEGTRLFALAGRPIKAQFVKVYGPKGPTMTWTQRAAAGVDAKHFQAALAQKSKA
jgi:hypothetical protein